MTHYILALLLLPSLGFVLALVARENKVAAGMQTLLLVQIVVVFIGRMYG